MIRRISSMTFGIAVSLAGTSALAQEASAEATAAVPAAAAGGSFGRSGDLALSVDRVFGFAHTSTKVEPDVAGGGTTTTSSTGFSLIGRLAPSAYQIPRFGIDYFITDNVSIGGSIAFMTESGETEFEGPGLSTKTDQSASVFLIAPRAGYALMFSDMFGIWPRGGFTFFTRTIEQDNAATNQKNTANGFSLTIEVPLILSPADHIALTIAPTLDFPITGSGTQEQTGVQNIDSDVKTTDFGVAVGLLTWF